MVGLAASATLSPIYSPQLFCEIFGESKACTDGKGLKTLVFIICGGYKISTGKMKTYREELKTGGLEGIAAFVDGMGVDL